MFAASRSKSCASAPYCDGPAPPPMSCFVRTWSSWLKPGPLPSAAVAWLSRGGSRSQPRGTFVPPGSSGAPATGSTRIETSAVASHGAISSPARSTTTATAPAPRPSGSSVSSAFAATFGKCIPSTTVSRRAASSSPSATASANFLSPGTAWQQRAKPSAKPSSCSCEAPPARRVLRCDLSGRTRTPSSAETASCRRRRACMFSCAGRPPPAARCMATAWPLRRAGHLAPQPDDVVRLPRAGRRLSDRGERPRNTSAGSRVRAACYVVLRAPPRDPSVDASRIVHLARSPGCGPSRAAARASAARLRGAVGAPPRVHLRRRGRVAAAAPASARRRWLRLWSPPSCAAVGCSCLARCDRGVALQIEGSGEVVDEVNGGEACAALLRRLGMRVDEQLLKALAQRSAATRSSRRGGRRRRSPRTAAPSRSRRAPASASAGARRRRRCSACASARRRSGRRRRARRRRWRGRAASTRRRRRRRRSGAGSAG